MEAVHKCGCPCATGSPKNVKITMQRHVFVEEGNAGRGALPLYREATEHALPFWFKRMCIWTEAVEKRHGSLLRAKR